MADDIKEILNHLVASPRENQIQIDFDIENKIFILSVPIYRSRGSLPDAIKKYVDARAGLVFKPHATSFATCANEKKQVVDLVQKIPFSWGFCPSIRQDLLEFLQLAKRCHRMLYEIALEEMRKVACLDSEIAP